MRTYKSLPLLLGTMISISTFGQNSSSARLKQENLYSRALFASIAEMDKQWGRQTNAPDYHHMFVEADPEITDSLASESGGYRVQYLDRKRQIFRYKKLRKEFALLKIHPIHDEGDHLKVTISVYSFGYKNGTFRYALSDWSDAEINFDCDKRQFVISSIKLGGI